MPSWLPGFLVLAIAVTLRVIDPNFVEELRLNGFDAAQRLWPQVEADDGVVIVAIDEQSLAEKGQWPWPRTLMAELVRRIAAGKPSVLGIDILFAEPDRFSPPRLAETVAGLSPEMKATLEGLPGSDEGLGKAIASVPTVLVVVPDRDTPPAGPLRITTPVREQVSDPRPFLLRYTSLVRVIPEIAQNALAEGSVGLEPAPDSIPDGVLRRVPLVISVGGRLIPAFAATVVALADHQRSLVIRTGSQGVEAVIAGKSVAPTDRRARAIMHFAPPKLRYFPAADVLDPEFDPAQFAGRIVLLGVTGLGIVDQKKTPLGLMDGVQLHAQLIQSIRDGSLLQRPSAVVWVELAVLLLAAAVPISFLGYDRPFVAAGAVLGLVAVLASGEFALFRFFGWLVDGFYAGVTALVTLGVMLADHLRATHALRRALDTELGEERERNARLAGELEAARAIQMGLLPRRFPVFTERDDIDLYAFIEPAREVGGDLFVFQLIDQNRLFFLIGDVSGKGIGAALFMAMTSEVVHDAARRHGTALGEVLTEANAKIAATSADMANEGGNMMFVTAFAGILDLSSGALDFASAGHDAPFVVQRGAPPRQLETVGGPPLGVVDDFTFPVDHNFLDLHEVLLLYTDGVTEATDGAMTLYGRERLITVLTEISAVDARGAIDAVTEDVWRFAAGTEQADDIALLALRRLSPTRAAVSGRASVQPERQKTL
jgi:serine phosphatase RsbU (regulator of sigma subunit)